MMIGNCHDNSMPETQTASGSAESVPDLYSAAWCHPYMKASLLNVTKKGFLVQKARFVLLI